MNEVGGGGERVDQFNLGPSDMVRLSPIPNDRQLVAVYPDANVALTEAIYGPNLS